MSDEIAVLKRKQTIQIDGAVVKYDPDTDFLVTECQECGKELSKNIGIEYVLYVKKKIALHKELDHSF